MAHVKTLHCDCYACRTTTYYVVECPDHIGYLRRAGRGRFVVVADREEATLFEDKDAHGAAMLCGGTAEEVHDD